MKTIYKGDDRYEKIKEQMDLLSITDVTTERQVLNGRKYRAYNICELPNNFGFHDKEPVVALREKQAITEWFNYKGLTYVAQ